MQMHDLIVLGRTVPEDSHRYGRRVCLVGYRPSVTALVRVYPLLIDAPLKARHQASLDVTRNPHDSRKESYRLTDAIGGIRSISAQPVLSTAAVTALGERLQYPSIAALNQRKVSLGFVAVSGRPRLEWKTRAACTDPRQLALFESFTGDLRTTHCLTGSEYPRVPYLHFRDSTGTHCLQLREWGCFEYLRKQDGAHEDLAGRLRLDQDEREWFVLLGNMTSHRTVWLVIQVVSRPRLALPFRFQEPTP